MPSSDWSKNFNFLNTGVRIQRFVINGHNIVLGFEDASEYDKTEHPYFGETIGRVCNRISNAKINNLNGRSYQLAANNGANSLHGGSSGWGKKAFAGPENVQRHGRPALHYTYLSPDGDEGYPGTVKLDVWYYPTVNKSASGQDEKVALEIEYEAQLVDDADDAKVEETAINVTNHSYFNVSGTPTVEGTQVTLSTNLHQATDSDDIPTGSIQAFPSINKLETVTLGSKEPDADHCFIMNDKPETVPLDTRSQPLEKLCELQHSNTGIRLEAFSTEPAFQFYTGKSINVLAVQGQDAIGPRSGICIEPSRYVNAVNVDAWRPMVILKRGQTYGSKIVYCATQT